MAYVNRAVAYTMLGQDEKAADDVELAAGMGINLAAASEFLQSIREQRDERPAPTPIRDPTGGSVVP